MFKGSQCRKSRQKRHFRFGGVSMALVMNSFAVLRYVINARVRKSNIYYTRYNSLEKAEFHHEFTVWQPIFDK